MYNIEDKFEATDVVECHWGNELSSTSCGEAGAREFEMNGRHFINVEWEKGQRLHTGAKVIGM
ncbi:MAG: hypothetical protein E7049_03030 [Lentisphaerae bacterium]|nr:hypothetical protein [Lentisphaerota bacterium]